MELEIRWRATKLVGWGYDLRRPSNRDIARRQAGRQYHKWEPDVVERSVESEMS